MGDMADGIINGDFDEVTGEYLGPGDGYPRSIQEKKFNYSKAALAAVQKKLVQAGYTIIMVKEIDYGYQMRTLSGTIINIYSSGKVVLQGKPNEHIKQLIK